LCWRATEVADLLETSVASVNSSLQRARATLAAREVALTDVPAPMDDAQRQLLDRYADAFQRYDMDSLTSLIHEDAMQSMPPYAHWLQGRDEILEFWVGPGDACRGSRLVPTTANGLPAFGQYRASGPGGRHEPWALQIIEIRDGRIVEFSFFLDTARMFPLFGLPVSPDDYQA
jgi:RNA polymerase sigma-70 factor (ECF subfamily)